MIAAPNRNTIWRTSIAALLLVSLGCSGRSSPPSTTQQAPAEPARAYRVSVANRPPSSVLNVGDSATDLFNAAWSSDWRRAVADLQSLNEAASELPIDLPRPDLVAELQANVASVADGAITRQRIKTMAAANALTQIVAELSSEYEPDVPYDVKVLGYYGRQIQLGVASGRPDDSARAVSDLVTVWDRTEPVIVRRGHGGEARRFTDLVVELVGARRPDDLVAPVSAELTAVSRLERIFTSPQ